MNITAKVFWELLGNEIKSDDAWKSYFKEDSPWTKYVLSALDKVMKRQGYFSPEGAKQSFTFDRCYFERSPSDDWFDWKVDIALEHENDDEEWRFERCKLSHVACGLKVLMAFHNYKSKPEGPRTILEEALSVIAGPGHPYKTCPNRWLFIFGPTTQGPDHDFEVYESEDGITLAPINSAIILNPCR